MGGGGGGNNLAEDDNIIQPLTFILFTMQRLVKGPEGERLQRYVGETIE